MSATQGLKQHGGKKRMSYADMDNFRKTHPAVEITVPTPEPTPAPLTIEQRQYFAKLAYALEVLDHETEQVNLHFSYISIGNCPCNDCVHPNHPVNGHGLIARALLRDLDLDQVRGWVKQLHDEHTEADEVENFLAIVKDIEPLGERPITKRILLPLGAHDIDAGLAEAK
jgi:hypothetical protein